MTNQKYEPDVRVKLRFLTTVEGGRRTLAYSNYRPQFFYAGHHYAVNHKFPKEGVAPGETTEAELTFASPRLLQGHIHQGTTFEIYEGTKKVAEGEILQILALEGNAQKDGSKHPSV
jgi:translation elongation factor EF-Tu-like GTPase